MICMHVPIFFLFFFCFLRDGCLSPRDELLALNGQSLKDLSGKEAETLIQSSTRLVNVVMASKVSMKVVFSPPTVGWFDNIYLREKGNLCSRHLKNMFFLFLTKPQTSCGQTLVAFSIAFSQINRGYGEAKALGSSSKGCTIPPFRNQLLANFHLPFGSWAKTEVD